jgi:hypothetical protein
LKALLASLQADREMQADLSRLDQACCAPQRLVTLQSAPAPKKIV